MPTNQQINDKLLKASSPFFTFFIFEQCYSAFADASFHMNENWKVINSKLGRSVFFALGKVVGKINTASLWQMWMVKNGKRYSVAVFANGWFHIQFPLALISILVHSFSFPLVCCWAENKHRLGKKQWFPAQRCWYRQWDKHTHTPVCLPLARSAFSFSCVVRGASCVYAHRNMFRSNFSLS